MRRVALALLVLPFAALGGAAGTVTSCVGGETEGNVFAVAVPEVRNPVTGAVVVPAGKAYLLRSTFGLFWEDNGVSGLQRTAKTCYTQTYDDAGRITSSTSWLAYPPDSFLTP